MNQHPENQTVFNRLPVYFEKASHKDLTERQNPLERFLFSKVYFPKNLDLAEITPVYKKKKQL